MVVRERVANCREPYGHRNGSGCEPGHGSEQSSHGLWPPQRITHSGFCVEGRLKEGEGRTRVTFVPMQ